MGLGGGPSEWDEYEWVRLADLPVPRRGRGSAPRAAAGPDQDAAVPLAAAICDELDDGPLWPSAEGTRVLLVDLDNLRAGPMHWRARMGVVAALARQAAHVVLAGQGGAVARARPHLAEFADRAQSVPDGSDVADRVLLRAADAIRGDDLQLLVVSNDGIFAVLAERGPLTVLSPGADALSDRLREASVRTVDLAALERRFDPPEAAAVQVTAGPARGGPTGRVPAGRRATGPARVARRRRSPR